jgi:flagellin-specific chaperone FliS
MKRIVGIVISALLLAAAPTSRSQAQIFDLIQQAIIAAITAADIVVQKAQSATLDLQNAQKVVENDLSKLNLGQIGDWEQQFKDIYSEYFNELKEVKTAISYFQEVTGIIAQQSQLVSEYKQAYSLVQTDKHFSASELSYIYSVYTGIIGESVKSLDQIILVLTNFSLQMSDEARLKIIKQASADIERDTGDLRNFNNQTAQISLQRSQSQQEINTVMSLYGISH